VLMCFSYQRLKALYTDYGCLPARGAAGRGGASTARQVLLGGKRTNARWRRQRRLAMGPAAGWTRQP